MSIMKRFGTNMATMAPAGQQGMMALLGGFGQARRADWDANNERLGYLDDAFGAHGRGQAERIGGYERANEAIFGPGRSSASSQLQDAIRSIRPMLTDRSSDLGTAMERAQSAFEQEDAMRGAGTRDPAGGSAFEQAQANAQAADASRASGMEAGDLGQEGMLDAMTGMQERYGEGLHGAGLAGMRAGMERDVGGIRGGAQDAIKGIHGWQAGQVQSKFNPMAMLARRFAPGMMQQGLAQGRQRRQLARTGHGPYSRPYQVGGAAGKGGM